MVRLNTLRNGRVSDTEWTPETGSPFKLERCPRKGGGMKGKRRTHTAAFKAQVALAALQGDRTASEPAQVYREGRPQAAREMAEGVGHQGAAAPDVARTSPNASWGGRGGSGHPRTSPGSPAPADSPARE